MGADDREPMADNLTIVTYNAHRERTGRDPALDSLLDGRGTLVCLQEVSLSRAVEIGRRFRGRSLVSSGKHGLQYLALVLPENARFLYRRTAQLNGWAGLLPKPWSVRRGLTLRRSGRREWIDALEPRVAQVADMLWHGRALRVVHAHLPYAPLLRDPCLDMLHGLLGHGDALLVGDLNATTEDLFLADLLLAAGMRSAGAGRPTHRSGRRIDHVLYRGSLREVGYRMGEGLSDHRVVEVELEVT